MFNLFKKKKRPLPYDDLTMEDIAFFHGLVNSLKGRYPVIEKQGSSQVIVGKSEMPYYGEGTYIYTLDGESWNKLANKKVPNFNLMNIACISKRGQPDKIKLLFMEGMIYGYQCTTPVENLDLSTIDISQSWVKHIVNDDFEVIKVLFKDYNDEFLSNFDLVNAYKVEINNADLYVIKNIDDGNFWAINLQGEVFELIHDPFQIQKVFDSVQDMYQSGIYSQK